MANNEASFRKEIRESVKYHNGMTVPTRLPAPAGQPDNLIQVAGYRTFWVELKWSKTDITGLSNEVAVPLSPVQHAWARKWTRVGGLWLCLFGYRVSARTWRMRVYHINKEHPLLRGDPYALLERKAGGQWDMKAVAEIASETVNETGDTCPSGKIGIR